MFKYSDTPQSIGKVLDNMFRLYGATVWKVIGIAFVAAIASNLPNFILPASPQEEDLDAVLAVWGNLIWIIPLALIASLYCYAVILHRMHALASGSQADLGDSLRVALIKLLPLLGATILYVLALTLGLIAFIIPGIIFGLTLYFYMPLLLIDNKGVFSSLAESHLLVWGNWWRTAAVLTIPLFIVMVFYGLIALVSGLVIGLGVSVTGGTEEELVSAIDRIELLSSILAVIVGAFVGPLFSALALVQVHDLKLRREGTDLDKRLAG